jgi:hypothetical protein
MIVIFKYASKTQQPKNKLNKSYQHFSFHSSTLMKQPLHNAVFDAMRNAPTLNSLTQ